MYMQKHYYDYKIIHPRTIDSRSTTRRTSYTHVSYSLIISHAREAETVPNS